MDRCINCRFGDFATHVSEKGECRRFAPRATIGQLDPAANYSYPDMAGWPVVRPTDGCGEFQADAEAPMKALTKIVRERIFGDGTAACEQRVIDLCNAARAKFGIERTEG